MSLELESSFSTGVKGDCADVSFSSLDFLTGRLFFGEALGLLEDLLSDSDSELLSGEKMLFFFVWSFFACCLVMVFGIGLTGLAPAAALAGFPLTSTLAADLALVEDRLRGGAGLGGSGLGASSSLDDDIFLLACLGFGSSFFFCGSSSGFAGDLGAGWAAAGVSDVEDSESELLEPDPELVDELPLLLESDVDPELLSVLLLLT